MEGRRLKESLYLFLFVVEIIMKNESHVLLHTSPSLVPHHTKLESLILLSTNKSVALGWLMYVGTIVHIAF